MDSKETSDLEELREEIREEQNEGRQAGHGVVAPSLLDRVRSRASSVRLPPDGGVKAWTMCLLCHIVIMNTWGVINSFGVFQTFYSTTLARPPSDIAWIGSFQIFLLFFVGAFTGRLTDAGYFRAIVGIGVLLLSVGVFTTAQATQYWHFFLSQGIAMGLGNGCLFCPCLTVLSTYFSSRRAMALGFAATGAATGGLIYPTVARQLLPTVGFPWTMRAIGFIQVSTLIIAAACMQPRLPPRRSGPLVELEAFTEAPYAFYAVGTFSAFCGAYVAFFYIASYSRDVIGLDYTSSLNLLLVLNGCGAIGRLIPSMLAVRWGSINLFIVSCIISGVAGLSWMAVGSTAGLYVWVVIYGIFVGGVQALFPAGLTSLTTDVSKTGVRMGMVFTTNSFATLTGPPVAGVLIAADNGGYRGAQIFCGTTLLVGACFVMCAKIALSRQHGKDLMAVF